MKEFPLILPQSTLRINDACNSNEDDAESRELYIWSVSANSFCFHAALSADDQLQHLKTQVNIDREATTYKLAVPIVQKISETIAKEKLSVKFPWTLYPNFVAFC